MDARGGMIILFLTIFILIAVILFMMLCLCVAAYNAKKSDDERIAAEHRAELAQNQANHFEGELRSVATELHEMRVGRIRFWMLR
jgi:predicted membrane protein